jgi:hypothetical protein
MNQHPINISVLRHGRARSRPSTASLPRVPIRGCPALRPGMTSGNQARLNVAATRERARALLNSAPLKGAARRKTQAYGIRIRRRTRRAPFGAPHLRSNSEAVAHQKCEHAPRKRRRFFAAFAERRAALFVRIAPSASAAALTRFKQRRPCFARRSGLRQGGPARASPSASSWQGLVVVPGGAPASARVPDPRDRTRGRRAPSRIPERLAKRPSTNGAGPG